MLLEPPYLLWICRDIQQQRVEKQQGSWQLQVKITIVTAPTDPKREVVSIQN
jgi:hypothetical protein